MTTQITQAPHVPQPFTLVRVIEWMRRELSWHITSWEDIGSIINGPLLFLAALIAGVNQITGGAVLRALPWVGISWAILQIVGIDMQYMASARRAKDAVHAARRGVAVGWLALALVLAIPVLWANVTFSLQLMLGWTDAQAMALLGLTPLMIAVARAVLQALLAFISAVTRETRERPAEPAPDPSVYTKPAPRPSGGGGGARTRKQNRNAGVSMTNAMRVREQRIATLRAYMDAHPGETLSISDITRLLDITSRSTAQSIRDKALDRAQAV